MGSTKFKTVSEYYKSVPPNGLDRMKLIRQEIKKAAPAAEEVISYNMPGLKYKGFLVGYAAYQKHIGFYPTPDAISKFENDLTDYKKAKGSVQFPYDRPLPIDLIIRMTKYRYNKKLKKE